MMKMMMGELREILGEVARGKGLEVMTGGYIEVGDEILYGKWKNKRGRVVDYEVDERGVPVIIIEPIPKGRKKNVVMGLYKVWKREPVEEGSGDI